ncbi:hypothetical protein HanPSC8_Chr04g0143271 [Helianthus annuus]|nr:hypothetical protein HanPSC8_Chr04g0143271 [Helianthus annuus]
MCSGRLPVKPWAFQEWATAQGPNPLRAQIFLILYKFTLYKIE